ncbi:ribonuclease P protein component [Methylobacterium sp. WL69]|uniref:ribonuclease P protein component n=1 Tax=Methylobacterium sp. WL69 TaxID=2603893 RepID=UPI0011C8DB3D|nr:ribonuclease P protein component [Methylobacterium sp. WL69]TXM74711.1 ribonuclease P protein component [Methylobacterium sp. WL69]
MSTIGRLTQRKDFLAAAGGRRFHTERFSAQGRLRDVAEPEASLQVVAQESLRIGFTITKRVGHATERNRIRRRLRAAVLAAADALPNPAADIVVVARRPALSAPFATLIEDLRRAVPIVTKPQARKESSDPDRPASRRGRGKGTSGASGAMPLLASGPEAAQTARATAPSPIPNACDGPTDG